MNPFAKVPVIRWVVAVGEYYVVRKGFLAGDRVWGDRVIKKGRSNESTQDQQ